MENYTQKEQNFLILIQALKYSTVGLQTYVDQCLEVLYDRLNRKVGTIGACTQSCNMQNTPWCNTCKAWKRETEKYMRYISHKNVVQQRNTELWKLSQADREAAKVELRRLFIRDPGIVAFDIQAMLSLLQNCTFFVIGGKKSLFLIDKFRKVRNILYAHTDKYEISRKQLEKALSSIVLFFRHPSFQNSACISKTVKDIKGLRTENKNDLAKIDVFCAFTSIQQMEKPDINAFLSNNGDKNRQERQHKFVPILALFFAILAVILGLSEILRNGITSENSESVCKDATYEHPFTMDIDLDFYRSQHDKLVGREWLLIELDDEMNFSKRGVLLLAEMGYGKSAIVAHLVCQNDKRFPGNWIYQRIVVYHLCNFYSQNTLSPGNFVKNLAGGFSKRIPGFLNVLQQNLRFKTYFEKNGCVEDPESCLDLLVLKTLNDLDMGNTIYIVVIDALDECIEHGNRNIFNLLWKRLRNFPKNIKFFITSRNTSDLTIVRTQLVVIEKNPSDPNNLKDAQKIINSKVKVLSRNQQSQITQLFKTNDTGTALSRAVKYTKGNILLLRTALTGWLGHDAPILDSYTTFEGLFDDQLKRIFYDQHIFKTVRRIFQVLCTAMEPLYVEELLEIADLKDEEIVDVLSIIGRELSHFVRQANGKISLVHKTFAAYLTDDSRKTDPFYISRKDGCFLFARYFLNSLNMYKPFTNISLVDLAAYVACSTDEKLKRKFLQYGKKLINEFSGSYLIHQAAAKLNSYDAMSLLLDLLPFRPIDETDQGNITASYVAAAFGNHNTLKVLLDRKANVNFTRLGPRFINETVSMLEFCKTFAFWDYSLLNIAAQNGHMKTVLTLLSHDINIFHQTSFGSNSFLLAVENGHTRLVREFLIRFRSIFHSSLNQALYLSAKNGYLDIVDLLLHHGAEDLCLPCNSSQYWTSLFQTRLQAINSSKNFKMFDFVFLDDRRYVRCETALETAIQNGYTEVVQRLLKSTNKTLRCRESGGRTPAFTALKFNRSEIFNLLMQQGINKLDRCFYHKRREESMDLSESERNEYLQNMCPFNTTLSHSLAYNWERKLFDLGQSNNIWNWTTTDSDGATPIHYACCAGNRDMINILERDGAMFDIKSLNGSTPVHSAAICRQKALLSYLLYQYPTSIFDNQNRSVSHYVAMSAKFSDVATEEIMNNDEYSVIYLENRLYEEVSFKDKHNKSPLHYACENGNVNLFNFFYKSANFIGLDMGEKTFLDSSLENVPVLSQNIVKIVKQCNIYLFSTDESCYANRIKTFIPHEYLIYMILKSSEKTRDIVLQNIERYVNISLQKNSAHLLGILLYNFPREYSQYMFKYGISSLQNLLMHHEINPLLFNFLPDMSYDCSKISKEATLHDIVQDERRTFWKSRFFDFEKFQISSRSLDECIDDYGYNFLHRSVMGGNHKAFFTLLKLGMSLSVKTRDGRNLIQLLVDNAPCFEERDKIRKLVWTLSDKGLDILGTWNENNFASIGYNEISSFLTSETRMVKQMNLHEICDHSSKSISFTHKVAAKGLIGLLMEIKKQFGLRAFNCVNKNGIATDILLKVFNHYNKFPFVWILDTGSVEEDIISSLVLKIILDFKPFVFSKSSLEKKCNYRMKNFRNIQRMNKCLLNMEKDFLGIQLQFLKLLGTKSQADFDATLKKLDIASDKNLAKFYSESFDNGLASIKNMFENRKDSRYGNSLSYDKLLRITQDSNCLNTTQSFEKNNSTHCLEMIAALSQLKIRYQHFYNKMKYGKVFYYLFLYQHKLNIPFRSDQLYYLNGTMVGDFNWYLFSGLLMSLYKPEFHMLTKYDFLDWFKSCKNCLAKEMMKRISSSTIREIRKWKGIGENIFLSFDPKWSHIPNDADTPLKKYHSYLMDDGET